MLTRKLVQLRIALLIVLVALWTHICVIRVVRLPISAIIQVVARITAVDKSAVKEKQYEKKKSVT